MSRILQVLLIIAIVIASAQICALTVQLLEPTQDDETASSFEIEAALRWRVYWFSGVVVLALGLWQRGRHPLAGDALSIAGVNLMLVGNNGGLYSIGYEVPRLTTSVITLLLLVGLAFVASKNASR